MTDVAEFVRWVPTQSKSSTLVPGWPHRVAIGDLTRCGLAIKPFIHPGVLVDQRIGWQGGATWVPQRFEVRADQVLTERTCAQCEAA